MDPWTGAPAWLELLLAHPGDTFFILLGVAFVVGAFT